MLTFGFVEILMKFSFSLCQITGDYLKTAVAIAEMVSILDPSMDENESAVDCSELRPNGSYLSNHELDAITWHRLAIHDESLFLHV